MRTQWLTVLAIATLPACYPFISNNRYQEAQCALDEDGDGSTKCTIVNGEPETEDCDDNNPNISAEAEEVPYDGLDNDCADGDAVDNDKDGYPGITKADYEAIGGTWPSGLSEELDCDDSNAAIYPGASDEPYDGVDGDCNNDCDYDADKDGFAYSRYASEAAAAGCTEPPTDCEDGNSAIFPGAPGEVPYDGEDQDCDGAHDFDPDGDGYVWADYAAASSIFLTKYGYTDATIAYTECFDEGDVAGAGTPGAPGGINPEASEISYDGIDQNCDGLNDFDRDGDGFMRRADRADFISYVGRYINFTRADGAKPFASSFADTYGPTEADWAAYFEANAGDCNDSDPAINPNAIEILGDRIDQDCDTGADGAFVRSMPLPAGLEFSGLGAPSIRSVGGEFIVHLVAQDGFTFGISSFAQAAFTLTLPGDSSIEDQADPTPVLTYTTTADYLSPAVDSLGDDYVATYALSFRPTTGNTRTSIRDTGTISGATGLHDLAQGIEEQHLTFNPTHSDVWSVSCGSKSPDTFVLAANHDGSAINSAPLGSVSLESEGIVDCAVDAFGKPEGQADVYFVQSNGTVIRRQLFGYGGDYSGATSIPDSRRFDYVTGNGNAMVFGGNSSATAKVQYAGTTWSPNMSGGGASGTIHADATLLDGRTLAVAVRNDGNISFARRFPGAGVLVQNRLGTLIPDFEPRYVSLAATDERVIMVATGLDASGDDHIAWAIWDTSSL